MKMKKNRKNFMSSVSLLTQLVANISVMTNYWTQANKLTKEIFNFRPF